MPDFCTLIPFRLLAYDIYSIMENNLQGGKKGEESIGNHEAFVN